MQENRWSEARQKQENAFSKSIDRLRSTHVGLPRAGGPIREWNSGVFSARTMVDDESSSSPTTSLPSIPVASKNEAFGPADTHATPPHQAAPVAVPLSLSNAFAPELKQPQSTNSTSLDAETVFDPQTQTYCFKYMVRRIEQELLRSHYFKRPLAVFVVAIDKLLHGPTIWSAKDKDRVLQAVSLSLFNSVRPVDLIGRYAEERFLILCPEINADSAKILAEKIRGSLRTQVVRHEWQEISLSVSIGIALSDGESGELETLLAKADVGADMALESGGNCSVCY